MLTFTGVVSQDEESFAKYHKTSCCTIQDRRPRAVRKREGEGGGGGSSDEVGGGMTPGENRTRAANRDSTGRYKRRFAIYVCHVLQHDTAEWTMYTNHSLPQLRNYSDATVACIVPTNFNAFPGCIGTNAYPSNPRTS